MQAISPLLVFPVVFLCRQYSVISVLHWVNHWASWICKGCLSSILKYSGCYLFATWPAPIHSFIFSGSPIWFILHLLIHPSYMSICPSCFPPLWVLDYILGNFLTSTFSPLVSSSALSNHLGKLSLVFQFH